MICKPRTDQEVVIGMAEDDPEAVVIGRGVPQGYSLGPNFFFFFAEMI